MGILKKGLVTAILLTAILCPVRSLYAGEGAQHFYYLGTETLSGPDGIAYSVFPILVEKVHNPVKSEIIERAIEIKPGGVTDYLVRLVVQGSEFTASNEQKTISGCGKLVGLPWQWTYLKATFQSTTGHRIDDENFMSDPKVLVARKVVYDGRGKIVQYIDVTVTAIEETLFRGLLQVILPTK